jgi:CRISPR-associated protein Csm4
VDAYRFTLTPRSPWATPWHADTLFGAICWAYRGIAGEARLVRLLEEFRRTTPEKPPPFVLSDALPEGYFPLPAGTMVVPGQGGKPVKEPWVDEQTFRALLSNPSAAVPQVRALGDLVAARLLLHASIDRSTGIVAEGQLFEVETSHFGAGISSASLFVRCEQRLLPAFGQCLELVGTQGVGYKTSTGLGSFSVAGPEPCGWLDKAAEPNGFLSLSHFLPARHDPVSGSWRLHVSYPKFQGNAVERFLKGRLVFLTPGSWFRTPGEPRRWYGRVLEMPRPGLESAIHYGLGFAVPARVPAG